MTAYVTKAASRQAKNEANLARSELGLWTYSNMHKHKNYTPNSKLLVSTIVTEFVMDEDK